jgi:phosphatidylserine decarboxylase
LDPSQGLRQGGLLAPEGYPFLLGGAAATLVLAFLARRAGGWAWAPCALAALFTLFTAWFFRNPQRTAPPGPPGQAVSPADGTVLSAGEVPPGRYNPDGPAVKLCIFMTPLNVHVNRAPVSGKVVSVRYNPGKFLAANLDKASLENEQNGVTIEMEGGKRLTYVQIAGAIARRIVCDLSPGDAVARGQRVGLIRFGSRVDVYFPPGTRLAVGKGDKVTAGETVIGVVP